jgi:hypothetical protein
METEAQVDHQHPDYVAAAPKWAKCRAVVAGEEAVHAAGSTFLPRLSDQSDQEYSDYKRRALVYGATARTVDGLSGLVFRRPPTIELPAAVEYLAEDADTADTPLVAFSERVVEELLLVGRIGLLADYPRLEQVRTQAEQKAQGGRPYMRAYCAESIINWRTARVRNRTALTLVVLSEVHEEEAGFSVKQVPQCRVLRLVDGFYTVEIWRKQRGADGKETWQVAEPAFTPLMAGKPLDFIPFLVCGPMGIDPTVAKPPLLDLVNVNLSHYRTTADYEHGLHFTGLPTPVVTGHSFDNVPGEQPATFKLGSSTIQAFQHPEAKAYFMEFEGKGLESLSKRLEEKESMMAALGARMLAAEKRQAEAAETAAIHRSGESSVLASLAIAAGTAISRAATWCALWDGVTEPARVQLNTDYLPAGMTAQELAELVKAWQASAISWDTLHDNLQRGEIARQGVSAEEEKAAIEAEGPKLGIMGNGTIGGGGTEP